MNLKNLKNRAGFTLIELIVVIAIMAILAGVAVPVYSGYIEKAEKAADLQLLDAVNSAFGAAVYENGGNPRQLSGASISLKGTEGAKTIDSVSAKNASGDLAVQASFDRYFAGNEGAKFKSITALYYKAVDGVFVDDPEQALSDGQKAVLDYLKREYGEEGEEIDQWLNSTFNDIGAGELLGQVDWVSDLASQAMVEGSDLWNIVNQPDYLANLMTSMGLNPENEADQEKFMSMAYNADGTPNQNFLANSLVLNVAKNTSSKDALNAETLKTQLTDGSIKTAISNNWNNENVNADTEAGLAQAALAYGMYTSYAHYIGDETMIKNAANMTDLSNLTTMLNDMYNKPDTDETTSFAEYMAGQGAADLDGYLAALQMAGDGAAQNSDVTLDILNNGFSGLDSLLGSLGK